MLVIKYTLNVYFVFLASHGTYVVGFESRAESCERGLQQARGGVQTRDYICNCAEETSHASLLFREERPVWEVWKHSSWHYG